MRESYKEFILFHQSVLNKKYVIFSQSNVLNNRVFFLFRENTQDKTEQKRNVQTFA